MNRAASTVFIVMFACQSEPQNPVNTTPWATEGASLIAPNAWSLTEIEHDPLSEHQGERIRCGLADFREENGGLEIDTTGCGYASITQTILQPVAAKTTIHIGTWSSRLASLEPAQGHLAVFFGQTLVWEHWVEIPGPAEARSAEVTLSQDVPPNTPVTFHLHNHGTNTWNINEISVAQVPSTRAPNE